MLVTFLRHGQSEHNAGLTAFLDSSLTHLGEQQAAATALRLKSEDFNSDNTLAFVSPLTRTLQTLLPIAEKLHLHSEVFTEVCEYFSVRNDGYKTFVGLSPTQISERFAYVTLGSRFTCDEVWWPQKQEDYIDLYERSSRVRDHLIHDYFDSGKQLLIVSHADPIGRMIESFLHIEPNFDGPPWSANCGITKLLVSSIIKPAEVIVLNDISHLTALSLETQE